MKNRPKTKMTSWIVAIFLVFYFLSLNLGCSLFESDQEKAEKSYDASLEDLKEKKIDEAILHLKKALEKNPHHSEAHYRLGSLYLKSNKPQLAAMELNLAISQDPGLTDAKKMFAALLFEHGAYAKAIPILRQLMAEGGNDLGTMVLLGNALVNTNNGADAIEMLLEAEKTFPDSPGVKTGLARALLLENQPERAREAMEKAASIDPKDITTRMSLARFYEDMGLFDLSEKELLKIKLDFPKNSTSYLALVRFYLQMDRLTDSTESLEQGIGAGLKDLDLFLTLAHIKHKQKNHLAALQTLKKAVDLSPDDQNSAILLADYYIFLKDYPKARAAYEQILEKWPRLLPVKTRMVEILIAENRYDQALHYIDEILEKNQEFAKGYILRGLVWLKKEDLIRARYEFLRARDLDPESAEGNYFYGLTFLDDQDYKMSLSEISKALEKDPNSMRIRLALSYIYFRTGSLSLAFIQLDKIIEAQPDNSPARLLRATIYTDVKRYKKAESDYLYLLQENPDSPLIRFRLAEIYKAEGKPDKALNGFKEILDSYPDPIKPFREIISIYVDRGAYKKALKLCDDRLKKHPKDMKIGLIKASVLLRGKLYGKAEKALSGLIREHPRSIQPLVLLANLHMSRQDAQRNFGTALKLLKKIIDIDPPNIAAYMKMAYIYKKLGDFDRAVEAYRAILEVNGEYAAAANDLAYLYADMGEDLDRALKLAKKAHELMPDSPGIADTLGWIYLKRGSMLMAGKYLGQAISSMPRNPLFHYHLGMAFYRDENFKDSAKEFEKAIKLGLGDKELASAGKLLKKMSTEIVK